MERIEVLEKKSESLCGTGASSETLWVGVRVAEHDSEGWLKHKKPTQDKRNLSVGDY